MPKSIINQLNARYLGGAIAAAVILIMTLFGGDGSGEHLLRMLFGRSHTYQQRHHDEMREKTLKALEGHPDREQLLKANPNLLK